LILHLPAVRSPSRYPGHRPTAIRQSPMRHRSTCNRP
jgi:hypothetical protein